MHLGIDPFLHLYSNGLLLILAAVVEGMIFDD